MSRNNISYKVRQITQTPKLGHQISKHSFLPITITDWNNLETSIKLCDSLESFKKQLDLHQSCASGRRSTGDHCLNIFYTRLCMLCSPLNDHLYLIIHVVEQPDCACGHIRESNKHFPLECLLYSNEQN